MTVQIYSKFPINVEFHNPNNNSRFVIQGTNQHKLDGVENIARLNTIRKDDWEWLKETYKDRKSFFDKFGGDMFYLAGNQKEADQRAADSKQIIDDKYIVSDKKSGVKKYTKDNLG